MYDDTNLLPCPFCGNKTALKICSAEEALDSTLPRDACECYAVVCAANPKGFGGCGASSGFRLSREAAAAAWNQRRSNNERDC